jgi:hypothetical protein
MIPGKMATNMAARKHRNPKKLPKAGKMPALSPRESAAVPPV